MVPREISIRAREAGMAPRVGVHRPSERNPMVRDPCVMLGFSKQHEGADGTTIWTLACPVEIEAAPMTVRQFSKAQAEL